MASSARCPHAVWVLPGVPERERQRRGPLRLWRPRYFNGGIAVHGSPSIPAYPASHGCARVSNAAMDMIWARASCRSAATVVYCGSRRRLGDPVHLRPGVAAPVVPVVLAGVDREHCRRQRTGEGAVGLDEVVPVPRVEFAPVAARARVRRKTSWRSKSASSSNASGGSAGRLVQSAALGDHGAHWPAPAHWRGAASRSRPWTTPAGRADRHTRSHAARAAGSHRGPSPGCRSRSGVGATSGCRRRRTPRRARSGRRGPAGAGRRTPSRRSRHGRAVRQRWPAGPPLARGRRGRQRTS